MILKSEILCKMIISDYFVVVLEFFLESYLNFLGSYFGIF